MPSPDYPRVANGDASVENFRVRNAAERLAN
jgi:hypothetical protein